MRLLRHIAGWLAAVGMLLIRWSCRVRFHNDCRPSLWAERRPYAYAFLHAHQVASLIAGEPGTGAVVSRSADADLLVPGLLVRRVVPMRGSTRMAGRDKGGQEALARLVAHSRAGRPVYFSVDGPRGPRNHVSRGIAGLAMETGAVILVSIAIPSRRWILTKTWDRLQIPKPFSRVDVYFSDPVWPQDASNVDDLRARIGELHDRLEREHDPEEVTRAEPLRHAGARRH